MLPGTSQRRRPLNQFYRYYHRITMSQTDKTEPVSAPAALTNTSPNPGGRQGRGFKVPFAHLGQGRSGRVVAVLRNQMPVILLVVMVIVGGLLSDVFLTP